LSPTYVTGRQGKYDCESLIARMRDEWKFIQGFGRDTLRKEYRLQDIGVDGRVMLKWIVNKWSRWGRGHELD